MAASGRGRLIRRVVSAALLVAVIVLVARTEGVAELPSRVARLDSRIVPLALLLPFVAVISGVRRWQLLLAHEGISLSFPVLLGSFLRGRFVGAFTPSTTGLDLYRLVDVAKLTGSRAASGRAILVEKLHGLVALSLVTFALLPLGLARFFGAAGIALAALLGVGSVLGLVLVSRPRLLQRVAQRAPKKIRARSVELADALASAPPTRELLVRVTSLGVLSHVTTAAVFVATGLALDVDASVFTLLVVGNAIVLATLLPISVGGVGVREGTAVALLSLVGVGAADATLVALLGYCVAQPPALLGGALELIGRREPALRTT